jgi:hypothetical protein
VGDERRQLEAPLGQRFQLVAIDCPRHGSSENAKDPAQYALPGPRSFAHGQRTDRYFVASFFRPNAPEPPRFFIDDALRTDGQARANLLTGIQKGRYRDEIAVLRALTAPIAVFHGAENQIVKASYFASLDAPHGPAADAD